MKGTLQLCASWQQFGWLLAGSLTLSFCSGERTVRRYYKVLDGRQDSPFVIFLSHWYVSGEVVCCYAEYVIRHTEFINFDAIIQ